MVSIHSSLPLYRRAFGAVALFAILLGTALCAQSPQASSPNAASSSPSQPSDNSKEDLTKLALTSSDLHANPPLSGETVQSSAYTRELVRVQWRSNDPIDLYVIRPIGKTNPPVVLFLYGYPSESDRFRDDKLCGNLVKNGFAAVGFVSALTGQRYHDRPMNDWFVSQLHDSLVMTVHDIQMILNYLDTRHDLDTSRIGIFGQGSGGAIATLAASVDNRLKAVDLMDPWGDWPDWVAQSPQIPEAERASFKEPGFLAQLADLDPVKYIPRLNTRPVRIQQNSFNLALPQSVRQQFDALTSEHISVVTYHDTAEYAQKVSTNARMLDWLHTQLNDPAKQRSTPGPE